MRGKRRAEALKMAEAICNAFPGTPGCCMTEDRKIRCTEKNCTIFPIAVRVLTLVQQRFTMNRGGVK